MVMFEVTENFGTNGMGEKVMRKEIQVFGFDSYESAYEVQHQRANSSKDIS